MTNEIESRGSTSILPALLAYQEWLRRVDQRAKTWAFLDKLIAVVIVSTGPDDMEAATVPWSSISRDFMNSNDIEPPTGQEQVLKDRTRDNWISARRDGYLKDCLAKGVQPVEFIDLGGSPVLYTFRRISLKDVSTPQPWRTEDGVVRWTRTQVDTADMSWIGRMAYPNGQYEMRGWRKALTWIDAILHAGAFAFIALAAWISLIGVAFTDPKVRSQALTGLVLYTGLLIWFYHGHMKPKIRGLDLRTQEAHPLVTWFKSGIWTDRINANQGRRVGDPLYQQDVVAYRELVRWEADCPICTAPLELKTNSPVLPGELIGCCFEVPDEHSFTFDRVTLEGRPLRARPQSVQ